MPVRCFYVFGSGDYGDMKPEIKPGAFVIAADGGLSVLEELSVTPDLIVGDFDSYGGALPRGVEVIRHPVMKDETDMELAVRLALERGAERIVMYGGLGGRLDHTFANIQLLVMLSRRGVRAELAGPEWTVTAVTRGGLEFSPEYAGTVSVFAYGGRSVVSETGLLYGLDRYTLTDEKPMGVSNSFTGRTARVTVHEGTCVIMWESGRRRE